MPYPSAYTSQRGKREPKTIYIYVNFCRCSLVYMYIIMNTCITCGLSVCIHCNTCACTVNTNIVILLYMYIYMYMFILEPMYSSYIIYMYMYNWSTLCTCISSSSNCSFQMHFVQPFLVSNNVLKIQILVFSVRLLV